MKNDFTKTSILIFSILLLALSASALPVITSFSLGTHETKTTSLTISITATDYNQMCFSTSSTSCTSYVDYATSYALPPELLTADTNNIIYAFVTNSDGNVSDASSDWVVYDPTGPTITTKYPTATDYNYRSFDFNIVFTDTWGTVLQPVIAIDGNSNKYTLTWSAATKTATLTASNLNEGGHLVAIDVNDSLGNTTHTEYTFNIDTNAPTAASASYSGWTNQEKPVLTITSTDTGGTVSYMRFSCSNTTDTNWTSWISYATTYSDFNMNSATYGCANGDWNNTIYIKVKDTAGNISANFAGTILYDNVVPSTPTSLAASDGNGKVTLSWSELVADDRSGNSKIEIYKNDSLFGDVNAVATSYEVNGLVNGTSYNFKVRAKDNAGNYSPYTDNISATPRATSATITVRKNSASVNNAKNGDVLVVECTFSASIGGAYIYYGYSEPSDGQGTLKQATGNVTTLSDSFTLNDSGNIRHGKIGFWCSANGAVGSGTSYVFIDNTLPLGSWLDTNNTFNGLRKVTLSASDNLNVNKVDINLNNVITTVTQNKDSNNNYYIDINTLKFENGSYVLSANIYDTAENKTVISRTITIENIYTDKQKAIKMINDAKIKQTTANGIINYFGKEALVVPSTLLESKLNADALLSTAETGLDTNAIISLANATSADELFNTFNNSTKVDSNSITTYTFDSNTLLEALKKIGMTEEQAIKTINFFSATGIERKLIISSIGGGAKQARIELTFTNDTNETNLKLIEIIPKELIDSAKKIVSDTNFRIVQEDPIIEFSLPVQIGEKIKIIYGIGEISSQKATSLTDQNILAKFSAPPIIADTNSSAEQLVGSTILAGNVQNILIIVIIIIIILVIAGVILIKLKKPEHGFGEKRTVIEKLTPPVEPEKPKWSAP